MRLEGKVAIITGAGQGIGEAFALRFVNEGAKAVVADINFEKAEKVAGKIRTKGGEAIAVHTDISDDASVTELAKKVVETYGRIDILLNNAALYYGIGIRPWDSWSIEDWDRIYAVNARGTWQCSRAVAPQMIKQGKGKIINIASGTADIGYELLLPYSCSKAAVVTLTRAMARALGQHNINVNCISPGVVQTEATIEMPKDVTGVKIVSIPGRCLPRVAEPEDMVGTAVFLASADSDYLSGQTIAVNGGTIMR